MRRKATFLRSHKGRSRERWSNVNAAHRGRGQSQKLVRLCVDYPPTRRSRVRISLSNHAVFSFPHGHAEISEKNW